jgi:DNA-binding XRE family transcriptional regulator
MIRRDPSELAELRKQLGFTQQAMANQLGLSLRAYHDIESGKAEYREIHRLAAERVALMIAVLKGNPMLAPADVRREALDLVALIRGD